MPSTASPLPIPRSRLAAGSAPIWECAAIGGLAFIVLLLAMPRFINLYDEGIVFSDAMRVASGDVIHRDFYSNYGPAQYCVVAGLLHWFDDGFLAARCYELAVRASIVALVFGIVGTQSSLFVAMLCSAICGLFLMGIESYLYPLFPCVPLALIGTWLVARNAAAQAHGTARLVAAGLCTGVAALVRYDVGAFLLIAHMLSIATLAGLSASGRAAARRVAAEVLAYGIGTSFVFLPPAAFFLRASPLAPFKADIIDFPSHYYAAMRGLPFPRLTEIAADPTLLAVYLPLLAAALAGFEFVRTRRRHTLPAARLSLQDACLVAFGLAAALLFLKGVVRVSVVHMFLGIVPGLVVLAIVTGRWWRRGRAAAAASVVVAAVAFVPAAVLAADFYKEYRVQSDQLFGPWLAARAGLVAPGRASRQCDLRPVSSSALLAPDYARITRYLAAHSRPDERILVATGRHDKIWINPVALYYTASRLPGTHWHHYDPGLQTRADIQQAMIADLQRNHVRWVVRDASFDDKQEPNESARSSGVTLLDTYLDEHYRRVAGSGPVGIWLENGEDPGPASPDPCEAQP